MLKEDKPVHLFPRQPVNSTSAEILVARYLMALDAICSITENTSTSASTMRGIARKAINQEK